MRLVAWNANNNNMRRSLEEDVHLLQPLSADILVLSEAAAPRAEQWRSDWVGDRGPGLAVVAPGGLKLSPHPANAGAPTLMAGFSVSGQVAFDLLAVWAVRPNGGPSYHDVLMAALDRYADLLSSGPRSWRAISTPARESRDRNSRILNSSNVPNLWDS